MTAAAPLYRANDLQLCRLTSLEPLADLSVTVQKTNPTPPPSGPGAACLFEMRTRDGRTVDLRVAAMTPDSEAEAQRLYRATNQVTVMQSDGTVPGIGDQAEAFSRQWEPDGKRSEYLIQARTANLVVEVWLAVEGSAFVSKATLARQTRAILEGSLTQVPRA